MLEQIEELAALLRRGGLRVSTAELLDAAGVARALGPADPAALRAGLRAALVKRCEDRPLFDELFDLYFLRRGQPSDETRGGPLAEVAASSELAVDDLERALDSLAAEMAAMTAAGRTALGAREADLATLVQGAGATAGLAGMSTPLQVGYYTYRVLEALGLEAGQREALEAIEAGRARGAYGDAMAAALGGLVARNAARIRDRAREHVRGEFRRHNLDHRRRAASASLGQRPLISLDARDQERVMAEIARLARVLRARAAPRRDRHRGRLDVRATLRRSLRTGGVPIEIVHRRRRPRRERLVILCDVSDSVRGVARFLLSLVHALQELFDGVHSFAFVAELGELTDRFRRDQLDRALSRALGGEVVNLFANSNYGAVFQQFTERHLGRVGSHTTVLVLGDGRSNYHPPQVDRFAAIARRAHRVIWLSPEPPPLWGVGDSAMRAYEPYCDEIAVASDLDSLRRVVEGLLAR